MPSKSGASAVFNLSRALHILAFEDWLALTFRNDSRFLLAVLCRGIRYGVIFHFDP